MTKAVFLDRDGVITQEPPHYAHKLDQLALIAKASDAIRRLNEDGFLVVIVSNQAGIAHGYYQEADTAAFNQALGEKLMEAGARIDAFYYCPHHPQAKVERYRVDCDCRKPKPGMLLMAAKELGIDTKSSYMVGDKLTDIEAGQRAGCETILVKTGYGGETVQNNRIECSYIADDLYDAARHILDLPRNRRRHDDTLAHRTT
ncbi:MAG: D-glycero-beta-D-manno-heptose 1,7-bisphosphate 7-phosphatase [Chloroflexi bacterium]|nr:D-glycero-beta-D-manno-heptose 1,7-bisphosphate 7-phosphatase [Chloroflexota bacterium]